MYFHYMTHRTKRHTAARDCEAFRRAHVFRNLSERHPSLDDPKRGGGDRCDGSSCKILSSYVYPSGMDTDSSTCLRAGLTSTAHRLVAIWFANQHLSSVGPRANSTDPNLHTTSTAVVTRNRIKNNNCLPKKSKCMEALFKQHDFWACTHQYPVHGGTHLLKHLIP